MAAINTFRRVDKGFRLGSFIGVLLDSLTHYVRILEMNGAINHLKGSRKKLTSNLKACGILPQCLAHPL